MSPFLAKRSFPLPATPVERGTSDFKITRGMVETGVVVSAFYSVNVTGAGIAVKARSLPIRRMILMDNKANAIQTWRAQDLVSASQIFEMMPIGSMLVPPSGFAVANYPGLEAHVPLQFEQYGAIANKDQTAIPTFAYSDPGLTLRVEWGDVTDLLVSGGALAGVVTFGANCVVTQLDYADANIQNGAALARSMPVALNRYAEIVQGAVASQDLPLDIGNGADIRGMLITQELSASTNEPTNTIITNVSLIEDNTLAVYAQVPWASLRADNARRYGGVTMPTGVAIIDFLEAGGTLADVYKATRKNKVRLGFTTAAVAGTIRAALLTIGPPVQV